MHKKSFEAKSTEFAKNLAVDFVKKLLVFKNLDSTNRTARDLAHAGADEGTVILAQTQSKGRGRFDRVWQSPEGGVYVSLILRPCISPEKVSVLPIGVALVVAKTVESYGLHPTIKWPNDVRINRKKIAGILLESEIKRNTINYVIVGIGINLNVDSSNLSSDIRLHSTSMKSEIGTVVDYYEFLRRFFRQFEDFYHRFTEQQYDQIIQEWKSYSDTLGKKIRIQTTTESIQGTAFDVDPSGFLLLRTEKGDTKKILSGDCLYFDELDHTSHET